MLAIRSGRILTITRGVIDSGTILVDDGKIKRVGKRVRIPKGATVIEADSKVVMPGMIDAHAHLGVMGEATGMSGADANELTDPITPHLRAIDAIHPDDYGFKDVLRAGVTTIMTGPGSGNVIGGQTAVVKTYGETIDDMVVLAPAGMKMALGENPKRVYRSMNKMPSTRMGNAALLREALVKAQNYMKKWSAYEDSKKSRKKAKEPERDLKMEALASVLRREIKARIHCHRADDILTALRIADEFNLDITLEHATEGYKIADKIAAKGVPAVVGPNMSVRSKLELKERTMKNPGLLAKAGVKVALQTDSTSGVQWLPVNAALAVREGMEEEEALKAITINAAEILGVADRLGSIEVGKDADIVMMTGHPFDFRTRVVAVLVNGKVVHWDDEAQ